MTEQYTEAVGRPFLPPYWSLGYHQCRFGYRDLNDTRQVMERTLAAGVPLDVQWNDLDYMVDRNDFTLNEKTFAGLPDFVEDLHKVREITQFLLMATAVTRTFLIFQRGMHYIPIIDPGVSGSEAAGTYPPWDVGLEMNVFVKNSSGQPFVGRVWNDKGSTVWPDFTHPNATAYWTKMFKEFHDKVTADSLDKRL